MNNQLTIVLLSDTTGKSGTAIIEAILSGERDGKKLARLANSKGQSDNSKSLSRILADRSPFWIKTTLANASILFRKVCGAIGFPSSQRL